MLNEFFKDRPAAWTAIFTGFLAIFTGVLTIFTSQLYDVAKSTDETAKTSVETTRAGQRAFLNFNNVGLGVRTLTPDRKGWRHQQFLLNWNNSGTTPAKDVVIQNGGQLWPTGLPKGFEFPNDPRKTQTVVGPKAIYGTSVDIPKDMLVSTWRGKSRLFLWGTVVYKDIFPNDPDRLTEFCIELADITVITGKVIEDPDGVITDFRWHACPEHNCYDEDCQNYAAKVKSMRAN